MAGIAAPLRPHGRLAHRAGCAILAVALVAAVWIATLALAGYGVLVIQSGSMAPALQTGDAILAVTRPAGEVKVGDVVTFRDPTRRMMSVTHRVVSVQPRGRRLAFVTRGDANTATESWSIPRSADLKVVVTSSPVLGRLLRPLTSPALRMALIWALAFGSGTWLMRRIWAHDPDDRPPPSWHQPPAIDSTRSS